MRKLSYFTLVCVICGIGFFVIAENYLKLTFDRYASQKKPISKDEGDELIPLDVLLEKPHSTPHQHLVVARNEQEYENTVIWAVLGYNGEPKLLNLFLNSVKGFGVTLFVQNVRTSQIDSVLQDHHINPLVSPYKCHVSAESHEDSTGNVGCRKNEWLWLLRQAWGLGKDTVCFTYDNVILHPSAGHFIDTQSTDVFNGIKLSKEASYPWCFGPKLWARLLESVNDFCDMETDDWEQSISRIISSDNEVVIPSSDLILKFDKCKHQSCTEKEIRKIERKVTSWSKVDMAPLDGEFKNWVVPFEADSVGYTTMEEHAQCRGKICEGYQFKSGREKNVYTNRVMDGKGETAYLIDLGPTCVDTSKIHVSPGGENVLDVWGRDEEDEFPRYDKGAFEVVDNPPIVPTVLYQKNLLRSALSTGQDPDEFHFKGTTIAYQRYDYANICFVIADIFNLYLTLEHVPSRRMLWLDGHALGNFDNVTTELFDMDLLRVGHMTGVKCFERLILMPRKYTLYYVPKFGGCENTVLGFVEKMKRKYNITTSTEKHDTVIVRDYYLAHPRVGKEVTRKFSTADIENIKRKLPNVKFVKFQELPWREQLQTIANTKTLYGMHGAGLTLGLFLEKGSKLVEWLHPSRTGTLTFQHYMSWRDDVKFERLYLKDWLMR